MSAWIATESRSNSPVRSRHSSTPPDTRCEINSNAPPRQQASSLRGAIERLPTKQSLHRFDVGGALWSKVTPRPPPLLLDRPRLSNGMRRSDRLPPRQRSRHTPRCDESKAQAHEDHPDARRPTAGVISRAAALSCEGPTASRLPWPLPQKARSMPERDRSIPRITQMRPQRTAPVATT